MTVEDLVRKYIYKINKFMFTCILSLYIFSLFVAFVFENN